MLLASAVAWASSACSLPGADAGPLQDSDHVAIAQVRTSYVEAELRRDRGAQAALYTTDAVLLEPTAPVVQGRRAIQAGLEEFDVGLTEFTLTSLEVGGSGSLAYDRGRYSLAFREVSTGALATDSGTYFMILRRQRNGSWRIAALIHNPQGSQAEAGRPPQ